MRLLILIFLLIATPVMAQTITFTPPDESESVFNYGFHYNALQNYPGDRWSTFVYDEDGALVINLESLTVPIIYGLVSGDMSASEANSSSNARSAPGFINMWGGKTFLKTPYGEAGVGLDAGFLALQATPQGGELELVAQAGPNLLFTSRPIENLHTVVHTSYQFIGLSDVINSGRIVLDIQGYYRLKSWLGIYGGFHWSSWDVKSSNNATDTYSSTAVSIGVAFMNLGQRWF